MDALGASFSLSPRPRRTSAQALTLSRYSLAADAVYEVIKDVAVQDYELVRDNASGSVTQAPARKVFVAGQSLGGFTAALTCLCVSRSSSCRSSKVVARRRAVLTLKPVSSPLRKYGTSRDTSLPSSTSSPSPSRADASFRPTITGGLFLCPMLAISRTSRPSYLVELVGRALASVAGPLPLASANKGKNSEDPEVEEVFNRDPQTYHGKLRIATGLAILQVRFPLSLLLCRSLDVHLLSCTRSAPR